MKKTPFFAILFILFILFFISSVFSQNTSIEGLRKTRTSKGYLFTVTYETNKKWTDGVFFKLSCTFSKGTQLIFSSSRFDNLKNGWHKTEIYIPKVYRDRYGYIKDYRVEMYHNGKLVSLKGI